MANFNPASWSSISVLVITSGSTGKICAMYSNQMNYETSFRPNIAFYKYNSTGKCGNSDACSIVYAVASPLQVTASPDSVVFKPNTYPDRESRNLHYYRAVEYDKKRLWNGHCRALPLVLSNRRNPKRDSPTEAAQAALSYWNPPLPHCPVMVVGVQLLGVSGFDVESG